MIRFNNLKPLSIALAVVMLSSCEKKNVDDVKPDNKKSIFSVFSYLDEIGYLSATDNIESGNLTVKGNGLELTTFGVGALEHEGYYYVWNSAESTMDQYKAEGTTFTKVTSIAVPPLLPDERPRLMRVTDDNKLILNSWPDTERNVYYALISLPGFTIATKGSVKLDSINSYHPGEAEFVVSGNKAYLGTSYFNSEYTAYPDSAITWVYDYPSFTNGKMLVSAGTPGNNGGYVGYTNVVDEKGDIYQAPINSSHWSYTNEDAYILKLSNGKYDPNYKLNLSDALGKQIGMWSIFYAKDGIAYAKIVKNDEGITWKDLRSTNTVSIVKINLYTMTAMEINLPAFMGFYMKHGVEDNGNFYLPIGVLNGEANVYSFSVNGGANDYKKGIKLEGNNILTESVFKH